MRRTDEVEQTAAPPGDEPPVAPRPPPRILVVDDDPLVLNLVQTTLRQLGGFAVDGAEEGNQALTRIAARLPDLVVLDVGLPGMSGLELLRRLKAEHPQLPVVMLTGYADVKTAVQAIQLGAYQFLTKPCQHDELMVTIRRALEHTSLERELELLRRRVDRDSALGMLLTPSPGMQTVAKQVRQVAASGLSVLVQGETGTGKDVVARAVHEESARSGGPLIALDCSAIPEALIESELFGYERGAFSGADRRKEGQFHLAEGGTLFLDEIGNLPPSIQSKLLRVLQHRTVLPLGATAARTVDVRFVAATNVPLEEAVRAGTFRQDLYYRLAEFTIAVPPLRERREDIAPLASRFREEASVELRRPVGGMEPEAVEVLRAHTWPGNVRELRNVVRQAVLLCEGFTIRADDLRRLLAPRISEVVPVLDAGPSPSAPTPLLGASLHEIAEKAAAEAERDAITRALRLCNGNKSHAARMLQVNFKTLHLKMRRYDIDPHE
jgi:DNA-binding NtrC family response regulator